MSSVVSVQFEWVYTPEDYFRNPVSIKCEAGCISIENGTVKAEIDPGVLKVDKLMAEKLDDHVENIFHDEQLKTQKPYELSMPFKILIKQDGSRTVTYV